MGKNPFLRRQKNSEQSNRDVTELAREGVGGARHRNVGRLAELHSDSQKFEVLSLEYHLLCFYPCSADNVTPGIVPGEKNRSFVFGRRGLS